jgi:hypothetical protein
LVAQPDGFNFSISLVLIILDMSTERRIKKDAQITITFGTSFIGNLQAAVVWAYSMLTPEQSEQLSKMIETKELDLEEPIMKHCVTLALLLREIENKAVETNQFIDVPIEETN